GECRTRMAKHLNSKQCAANRANDSMNSVPHRIDPRNFIGEEFQEIENTGDGDNPRVTEDLERLVLRRKSDPMKMNGQAGGKNREIQIDPGKCGKTERDSEQIESFHKRTIQRT